MAKISQESEEKILSELKSRELSAIDCASLLGISEKYAQKVLSALAKAERVEVVGQYTIRGKRAVNRYIYGEKKPEMFTRRVHIMQDDDLNPRQLKTIVRVHRDPLDELLFGAAK